MIKNLLLTAWRNFKKDKWYSLLNVLGLTIGITFSLYLIFYVTDELSYDRYQKNADRIYRINTYIHEKDKNTDWTLTQLPLGPQIKKDYPEVEEMARFISKERTLFKNGENNYYETKVYYADSSAFKVLDHHFIEGNAATAMSAPFDIVITKSLAEKYFGKWGESLWRKSNGIDHAEIEVGWEQKSMSHENTFEEDKTALHRPKCGASV